MTRISINDSNVIDPQFIIFLREPLFVDVLYATDYLDLLFYYGFMSFR